MTNHRNYNLFNQVTTTTQVTGKGLQVLHLPSHARLGSQLRTKIVRPQRSPGDPGRADPGEPANADAMFCCLMQLPPTLYTKGQEFVD